MRKVLLICGLLTAMMLVWGHALTAKTPGVEKLQGTIEKPAENPYIDGLYQQILELKDSGSYDAALWDEYFAATGVEKSLSGRLDEGGETCADATVIPGLPYNDIGTTVGYNDDYDVVGICTCPWSSTSPDVVYVYSPATDVCVTIDLCDSGYDTKVFVYEDVCDIDHVIACDDDGCPGGTYRSIIICVTMMAGHDYYIVVDGYGGDAGTYDLKVYEFVPVLPCPDESLFSQPPYGPNDPWTAGTSDIALGWLRHEDFWDVDDPICDIHFWGLNLFWTGTGWEDCTTEDPMQFEIIFYQDAGGLPGAIVCQYIIWISRVNTSLLYAGYPLYYYSTDLDPCCLLSNGWVSIQGVSIGTPNDCSFLWMASPCGNCQSRYDGTWADYDLSLCLTGEVEEEEYDLGDFHSPGMYPSLGWFALGHPAAPPNGNPAHLLSDIAWLGPRISAELWADLPAPPGGFPGHDNVPIPIPGAYEAPFPASDSTDDGVFFHFHPCPGFTIPGFEICKIETVTVTVTAGPNYEGHPLFLSAWKDGNLDSDFNDDNLEWCQASEWIIQDVPVGIGPNVITFLDPGVFALVGEDGYDMFFRFRLFAEPRGRHAYGLYDTFYCELGTWAIEDLGEVEDYEIASGDMQLPVELTTFEALAGDRQVTLKWTTASEQDNAYFGILRNGTEIAQVEGAGNSQTANHYEHVDNAVVNGVTYNYQLVSHDINGTIHEYETVEATPEAPIPTEYALGQNFPNPFNPTTSISYSLKEAGFVTLNIYNLLGQEVANLVSRQVNVGQYSVSFDASNLPAGIYIYRLEVNDFTAQKKMVLLK